VFMAKNMVFCPIEVLPQRQKIQSHCGKTTKACCPMVHMMDEGFGMVEGWTVLLLVLLYIFVR
jgi:hypothetical protein